MAMNEYRNYAQERREEMACLIKATSPVEALQNIAIAIASEGIQMGLVEDELVGIRADYELQFRWAFNSILRDKGYCTK